MSNITRWGRPSIFDLRRDIDDVLQEFTTPRALRREVERLFDEDLSPRSIWQEMDRLFDDFVSPSPLRRRVAALLEPFGAGMMPMALGPSRGGAMFVPELELTERDNEYMLNVDIPGVRPDDVQVSVDDNNILTIRGSRREEESRQQGRGYEYSERSYGAFARSIELPRNVDPSKVDAEYRDGVLQLHIPKSEQGAMRRQIPIKARESGRERELGQSREQGRDQPRVMGPSTAGSGERREQRDQRNQSNPR